MALYTLTQVETALLSPGRLGQFLKITGTDFTVSPNNLTPRPALADAIASALIFCSVYPIDPNAPSDLDIAKLTQTDSQNRSNWLKLLDIAEYQFMVGYFMRLGTTSGSIRWADYAKSVDYKAISDLIKQRLTYLQNMYGYGAAKLTSGTIRQPTGPDTSPEF